MANLPDNTEVVRIPITYHKQVELSVGQKISDITELMTLAEKIVPSSKKAIVQIAIDVNIEDA